MDWRLLVKSEVQKKLNKLPRHDADRILEIIKELPADPYAGDIERMHGEDNAWRRRVGAYRIFYEILGSESVIYVFEVKRRTSSTY